MSASSHDPEFRKFISAEPSASPLLRPTALFTEVHRDLNPAPGNVFLKLIAIHVVTSIATLSICPQFGFRLFGEGMGLMHYFMALGERGCLVACGTFYMGATLAVAGFILRGEELRTIRQNRALVLGALALLTFGVFVMADAAFELQLALGFSFTVAWFVGTAIGGLGFLEASWRFRFQMARFPNG